MLSSYTSSDRKTAPALLTAWWVVNVIFFALFTYLDLAGYWQLPYTLPHPWNDYIIYILIILAASSAAVLGFLLTQQFKITEPQFRIWLFFSIGLSCWLLGELSGFIYRQVYVTLPDLTVTDLFWTAGYFFFGLSLYYQYILIYVRGNIQKPIRQTHLPLFGFIAAIILFGTLVITLLAHPAGMEMDANLFSRYMLFFYPICDLAEGITALWFAFIFRRGILGRPWIGLLLFALSDGISSWYWMGGASTLNPVSDNVISLISDVLYIGGYLAAAAGCLSIFLMIKFSFRPRKNQADKSPSPHNALPGAGTGNPG